MNALTIPGKRIIEFDLDESAWQLSLFYAEESCKSQRYELGFGGNPIWWDELAAENVRPESTLHIREGDSGEIPGNIKVFRFEGKVDYVSIKANASRAEILSILDMIKLHKEVEGTKMLVHVIAPEYVPNEETTAQEYGCTYPILNISANLYDETKMENDAQLVD